jgi:hypothetical protein
MELVTKVLLDRYLARDSIASLARVLAQPGDETLTSQRWLAESPAKRLIFERLYGDLLQARRRLRILDIGGGLTAFSRELARCHEYVLLDLLAHDTSEVAAALRASIGHEAVHAIDWYEYRPEVPFDLVVANDLFPNVDQRLELFLEHFLPWAGEIRISLTYYDTPRFYLARRIGAEEIVCMLAWNGPLTRTVLDRFRDRIQQARLDLLTTQNESVFSNGRQVCLVTLHGMNS